MKKEKLRGINVYLIIILTTVLQYILISFEQFMSTIVTTFLLILFISYKYVNYPKLILHYVNPFLFLHMQSFVLWSLIVGHHVDNSFVSIYLNISVVAISTFNLFFLKVSKLDKNTSIKKRKINPFLFKVVKYISLFSLLGYLLFFAVNSGFNSKRAIKDFVSQHSYLKYIYAMSNLFLVSVFYELLERKDDFKKQFRLFVIYTVVFLLVFLILGERDLLFSLGIGIIFIFSQRKKKFLITKYYLFIMVIIFIGPYSQLLKTYFKSSEKISFNQKSFTNNGFDDFMTTGHNTLRIYQINKLETLERNLILSDLGNLVDYTMNSGLWFNRVYLGRSIGTTGLGFSLPLVGYLDFKYFGVFFVYLIMAIVTAFSFNNLKNNNLGVSFIIFSISLLSYVQRQDLAFFMNYIVKFVFIPYLFMTTLNTKKT